MKRKASAVWNGTGREGKGTMSTRSGAIKDMPLTFAARVQDENGNLGTNPEELLATAHAGCFAMASSFQLSGAGFTPDQLDVTATLEMLTEGGIRIESIHLEMRAKVPGISEEQFQQLVLNAKEGCPVSKLFNCTITLDAQLV